MRLNIRAEYGSLLRELSDNCSNDQPCSALRENYSNSSDAGATKVHFSSLAALEGFAHFDNGSGISSNEQVSSHVYLFAS